MDFFLRNAVNEMIKKIFDFFSPVKNKQDPMLAKDEAAAFDMFFHGQRQMPSENKSDPDSPRSETTLCEVAKSSEERCASAIQESHISDGHCYPPHSDCITFPEEDSFPTNVDSRPLAFASCRNENRPSKRRSMASPLCGTQGDTTSKKKRGTRELNGIRSRDIDLTSDSTDLMGDSGDEEPIICTPDPRCEAIRSLKNSDLAVGAAAGALRNSHRTDHGGRAYAPDHVRVIDHDQEGSMELKKREGYF